jgi:hypothetical protein
MIVTQATVSMLISGAAILISVASMIVGWRTARRLRDHR